MIALPILLLLATPEAQGVPAADSNAAALAPTVVGRYRLSGARELRPVEISDDGIHTYVRWSEAQDLPAVFALNTRGEEEMVDGYMRDGVFTIDRINARLVFRIDQRTAKAERSGKAQ